MAGTPVPVAPMDLNERRENLVGMLATSGAWPDRQWYMRIKMGDYYCWARVVRINDINCVL
jgi:hypothetical protein